MLRVSSKFCEFLPTMSLPVYRNAHVRPSKKKNHVSRPDFYKKRERTGGFFCYLLFPIACFLYTLLPPPGIRWSS